MKAVIARLLYIVVAVVTKL